jgi:hypothetical protein
MEEPQRTRPEGGKTFGAFRAYTTRIPLDESTFAKICRSANVFRITRIPYLAERSGQIVSFAAPNGSVLFLETEFNHILVHLIVLRWLLHDKKHTNSSVESLKAEFLLIQIRMVRLSDAANNRIECDIVW